MRETLKARALALIDRLSAGERDDVARDEILLDLANWQGDRVDAFRRLFPSHPATQIDDVPAMPTDVFRFARIAVHSEQEDRRVFHTSGTTQHEQGKHAFRDLELYDRSARTAARYALFPDRATMRLLILAPDEHEAPHSSLSYMLARFVTWFGDEPSRWIWRNGRLDEQILSDQLAAAERGGVPIALLGTSFAFVHACDALGSRSFRLPTGSRIMQTGGFKGRSRTLASEEMRDLLSRQFGIPEPMIIAEYGMTELSSQLYETTLRDALLGAINQPRRLWYPGWVRVTPVDPDTLCTAPADGLLRIDDVANLDSCVSIQTADIGYRLRDGIVLRGRSPGAVPRGCSIAADIALQTAAGSRVASESWPGPATED